MNQFKNKSFCYVTKVKPYKEYLEDLAQSKFVLSPAGTGLDCYRVWEAILVGCIPIIKSSSLDSLYVDLPVLIIDDWNQINENFLEYNYRQISLNKYNQKKLFIDYWLNLLKRVQKEFSNE